MSELESLKRRVVRETVAENIALVEGTRRERQLERRARKMRIGRWAVLFVFLAVVGTPVLLSWPWDQGEIEEVPLAAVSASVNGAGGRESPEPRASRWVGDPTPSLEQAPERIDPSIFPLRVRHIVLDPGHGGEDHGTKNDGLAEKDLTLDIALRLRELLRAKGFRVSMTRERDEAIVLRQRRDLANQVAADIFVSIHVNWIVNHRVRGVETYFLGPAKDPELNAVARRENRNSGYTLVEQSSLVRGLVLNAQHERSAQLAGQVQGSLYSSLREINPTLADRGVKTAPFVVLIGTEMPAILAEVSCLSNDDEVELLRKPLYKEHIAQALFKGLVGFARDVSASDLARLGP